MCSGRRLLADFQAGRRAVPAVPDAVAASLTCTLDGVWIVLAHKVARAAAGGRYKALTGGDSYPADAVARCRHGHGHRAPDPGCTCGFHAVSPGPPAATGRLGASIGPLHLDVALSGRVLAFEWPGGGVLFRAERQTVISLPEPEWLDRYRPAEGGGRRDGPDGALVRRGRRDPSGSGPIALELPRRAPVVRILDDAGYCHPSVQRTTTQATAALVDA